MISYVTVGTNRFEEAVAFWDAIMPDMGAVKVYATETGAGWGRGIGTPMFCLTTPYDKHAATIGNGCMTAFDIATPELVDALHAKVLALGGTSEGDPGPRGEQIYSAYWRDLDGNKFNFFCYQP
jgi:hypothetical protein